MQRLCLLAPIRKVGSVHRRELRPPNSPKSVKYLKDTSQYLDTSHYLEGAAPTESLLTYLPLIPNLARLFFSPTPAPKLLS